MRTPDFINLRKMREDRNTLDGLALVPSHPPRCHSVLWRTAPQASRDLRADILARCHAEGLEQASLIDLLDIRRCAWLCRLVLNVN